MLDVAMQGFGLRGLGAFWCACALPLYGDVKFRKFAPLISRKQLKNIDSVTDKMTNIR
jgi:hypothetical protein